MFEIRGWIEKEVADLDKEEFRKLCENLFKKHGFIKRKRAFYFNGNADVICSIYFQGSCYGGADYIACCFTSKPTHPDLQYPTYYETDMIARITVPGKERLVNQQGPYETEMIKYNSYSADEITFAIDKAMLEWILPAAQNGIPYIFSHWNHYERHILSNKIKRY